MSDRFLECLPYVLAQECPKPNDWSNSANFSDDSHDPGGKTMCGIIQREYDTYRKEIGEPTRDVREITAAEGEDIYRNSYWLPHAPTLPEGLDLCYFDSCVNEGCTEANRILQYSLNISTDGVFGPETAAAVAAIRDVAVAIRAFTARREAVYHQMKGFPWFGRGWLNRCANIADDSNKMCA